MPVRAESVWLHEGKMKRIGELLLERHYIEQRDLDKALVAQAQVGGRLGSVLVRSGAVSETHLLEVLSAQLEQPIVGDEIANPTDQEIDEAIGLAGLSVDWLLQQEAVLWVRGDVLWCLARDSFSPVLCETLAMASPVSVRYALARAQVVDALLAALKSRLLDEDAQSAFDDDIQHLRELAEEAPVVELVNNVISQAMEQRASDIHIEPEEEVFSIRYRIDGVLYSRQTLPKQRYYAVASRLKLVSGLDIAERRLPQDGRIGMRINGQDLDIRVSALPSTHGESIVMRLLPKERKDLLLDRLGMLPDHLVQLRAWVAQPHGIILVTGPTGSGKSTTLYSALDESNDGQRKIITVEDPVEFDLPHVIQVQAHSEIGMTFARALRSILRQDPDVIMIGEIRDLETAEIAVQSALTGHLVLSTLHTNDALSAFTRLVDMGIEPFLAATPIIAVQAQRLVRRLCAHCAEPDQPPTHLVEQIEQWAQKMSAERKAPNWHRAVGCPRCHGTGYKGRLGIYELVTVSESLRDHVLRGSPLAALRKQAREEGSRDLLMDGLLKARQGHTTHEEVMRVASLHE